MCKALIVKLLLFSFILWFLTFGASLLICSDGVTVNGQVNINADFYSANGIEARHPGFVSRAIARTTVSINNIIQLPFEVYLTTNQVGFQQPFNQIGISPKIGDWLQLHAGYFSKKLSNLTFGDLRILGGGIDITPGDFRASIVYGLGRIARSPDSLIAYQGEYSRTISAIKLGYGDEMESFMHVNIVRSIDDTNSIKTTPSITPPQPMANTVASISSGLKVDKYLRINGEASVSATTRSLSLPSLSSENTTTIPTWVLPVNSSSSYDKAFRVSAFLTPTNAFSLQSMAQWIGPGFISQGFPQLQNDIFEWTVSPSIRLFSNTLFLKPSVGIRNNNVVGNKFSTTTRTIGSFVGMWQPTSQFSLNTTYTNFGMSSEHQNDTLLMRNIFSFFSINPRYTFRLFDATSTIGGLYSFQDVEDQNPVLQFTNRSKVQLASIFHSLIFPSTLSFHTNLSFNSVITSLLSTKIFSVQEKVSKGFTNHGLTTSLQIGINYIEADNSDVQMLILTQIQYDLGENLGKILLNSSLNSFLSQDERVRSSFRELQSTLQYSLSF